MNMSSLTPGMAAVQAYRARGGVPLGGGGLTRTGGMLGAQGGGDTSGLGAAQAMQGQLQPSTPGDPMSNPGVANTMARINMQRTGMMPLGQQTQLRPPSNYGTAMFGGPQSMNTGSGMAGLGMRMQGPPNAGGVRVGGIRPPNVRAMNNRY